MQIDKKLMDDLLTYLNTAATAYPISMEQRELRIWAADLAFRLERQLESAPPRS